MNALVDGDKDLSEIPSSQRRGIVKKIEEYEHEANSRNDAIALAYRSGGYTLKELGEHFGLHYATVSRLLKNTKHNV